MSTRFTHVDQFNSDAVQFAAAGVSSSATASETKDIDYTVPYDLCITGAVMLVKGAKFQDIVSLKVVHPVYGVINTFVTGWYIAEDSQKQFELQLNYPANLPAGLVVRATYVATAEEGTRQIAINYLLHKVMV